MVHIWYTLVCLFDVSTQKHFYYSFKVHTLFQALNNIRPLVATSLFQFLDPSAHPRDLDLDKNYEEFNVVWLDADVNVSCDCLDMQRHLRSVINYLRTFSDAEECLKYLMNISIDSSVFLIVSGTLAPSIWHEVNSLSHILCLYVYCFNTILELQMNSAGKYRGIFVDKHSLLAKLTDDVRIFTKSTSPMSVFCLAVDERSIVSADSANHTDFQSFIRILATSDYTHSPAKAEMIDQCRLYYKGNSAEYARIDEFDANYQPKDAIRWYTRDSFIYRLLNKAFRTQNVDIIFRFRFFVVHLLDQLEGLVSWDSTDETYGYEPHIVIPNIYRGQRLHPKELERLQNGRDHLIAMTSFVSTTRFLDVAEMYAGGGADRPFLESVIFDIRLNGLAAFHDIQEQSYFKDEGELMLEFGAIFRIVSIENRSDRVWLIVLELQYNDESTSQISLELTNRQRLMNFCPLDAVNMNELPSEVIEAAGESLRIGYEYGCWKEYEDQFYFYQLAVNELEQCLGSQHQFVIAAYTHFNLLVTANEQGCFPSTFIASEPESVELGLAEIYAKLKTKLLKLVIADEPHYRIVLYAWDRRKPYIFVSAHSGEFDLRVYYTDEEGCMHTLEINVRSIDTLYMVKNKLEQNTCVNLSSHRLIHKGYLLDDQQTLIRSNITWRCHVFLTTIIVEGQYKAMNSNDTINILIMPSNLRRTIKYTVEKFMKIVTLRHIVCQEFGNCRNRYFLFHNQFRLYDECTIHECDIRDGAVLTLIQSHEVFSNTLCVSCACEKQSEAILDNLLNAMSFLHSSNVSSVPGAIKQHSEKLIMIWDMAIAMMKPQTIFWKVGRFLCQYKRTKCTLHRICRASHTTFTTQIHEHNQQLPFATNFFAGLYTQFRACWIWLFSVFHL